MPGKASQCCKITETNRGYHGSLLITSLNLKSRRLLPPAAHAPLSAGRKRDSRAARVWRPADLDPAVSALKRPQDCTIHNGQAAKASSCASEASVARKSSVTSRCINTWGRTAKFAP